MKTNYDKTIDFLMLWNDRKIDAKDAMFKIYELNEGEILSRLNPDKNIRKCSWCFKRLPKNRTSFCNREHKTFYMRESREKRKNEV